MNAHRIAGSVRSIAIGMVIGAVGFALSNQTPVVQAQHFAKTSYRTIDREPIVIFDVSGWTFAGVVMHRHLAVYSDGLSVISSMTGLGGGVVDVNADMTIVAPGRVARLHQALLNAGALGLVDQAPRVADVPTTTITVFAEARPGSDHNTFSFDLPVGNTATVMQIIDTYIAETMPDFQVP